MRGDSFLKDRVIYIVKSMAGTFLKRNVTREAAALSYYLTLSVFPFLLCMSAILSSMYLGESEILEFLTDIVPEQALAGIGDFLTNAGENTTELMLFVGITGMVTSSSAAFRSFTGIMGEIQGKMRFTGIRKAVYSFVFSVVFLAAIYVSGLVILSGGWFMQVLEINYIIGDLTAMWTWMRFVILFLLLFGIIFGMYAVSAPREAKKTQRLPGALVASVVLVAVSMVYSRIISASIRHTILYGSLASFIILMIWLYTCGIILIMGNVFNIARRDMRKEFSVK